MEVGRNRDIEKHTAEVYAVEIDISHWFLHL
jgi:hypothetical protein